jgi:hypothetical protein
MVYLSGFFGYSDYLLRILVQIHLKFYFLNFIRKIVYFSLMKKVEFILMGFKCKVFMYLNIKLHLLIFLIFTMVNQKLFIKLNQY